MKMLLEGRLVFMFPDDWRVLAYDKSGFYRKIGGGFQSLPACKAVDIVALDEQGSCVWLIEVKDYRRPFHPQIKAPVDKTLQVIESVAAKARDTLAGLWMARSPQHEDCALADFATACFNARSVRLVLHRELPESKALLGRAFLHNDNLLATIKLRQRARAIDAHALVCRMESMPKEVAWQVCNARELLLGLLQPQA